MSTYDYIIVGAGPAGLTLSWYLSKLNNKILIIDREKDVGGCHAVRRINIIKHNTDINNLFTEHGPRIYLGNYNVLKNLLNEFGTSFDNYFTKYNFTVSNIGGNTFLNLQGKDLLVLFMNYIRFMFTKDFAKKWTLKDFTEYYNFSNQSKDYIDRLSRLTDGAGYDRYTVYEFFQLINQNGLYNVYQPKQPNDVGLFKLWKDKLLKQKVDILLNTKITKLVNNNNKITQVIANNNIYSCKNVILAVPPKNLVEILQDSNIHNSFGDFGKLQEFATQTEYITDISVVFHWKNKFDLPKKWGFPTSDWGIAYIVLSDYMDFNNENSNIVISSCVTRQDTKSSFTGKTANESDEQEVKDEVLRQLRSVYQLPDPDFVLISPGNYRENNKWQTYDTAYIKTINDSISNFSKQISNLYNVGTHNGHSEYSFTSMESAMQNAVYLFNQLNKKQITIDGIYTVNYLIFVIMIIIILVILFKFR